MSCWLAVVYCRCLCYPQVIYQVIEKAAEVNFDVLRLLKNCSQHEDFQTDWAMKPGTHCPSIELNATLIDIAVQMGDTPLLAEYVGKPMWSWSHLLQAGDIMASKSAQHQLAVVVLGEACLQYFLTIILSIAPIFLFMHHCVLKPFNRVYRELPIMQQLVTCQHAVYAAIFGLEVVPQTVLAIRFLYKAWTGPYFASHEPALLIGVFILSRAALYLVEACVRSIHFSWLLLIHHELFFTIILMGLWTENPAVCAIGIVLDLFACHEVFLYISLVFYRLQVPRKYTISMLGLSCAWYTLTRVLQTVLLLYMIIGWAMNPAVKYTPAFIITAILCGAFTVIQAYTLVIYKAIGVKVLRSGGDQELPTVTECTGLCKDTAHSSSCSLQASADVSVAIPDQNSS